MTAWPVPLRGVAAQLAALVDVSLPEELACRPAPGAVGSESSGEVPAAPATPGSAPTADSPRAPGRVPFVQALLSATSLRTSQPVSPELRQSPPTGVSV